MGYEGLFNDGSIIVANSLCHLLTFSFESISNSGFINANGAKFNVISNFTGNKLDFIIQVIGPKFLKREHANKIGYPIFIVLIYFHN